MYELVPILAGAAAGVLSARLESRRLRALAIGLIALLSALTAGLASGELARSPAFLLWDTGQALAAALLVRALLARVRPGSASG